MNKISLWRYWLLVHFSKPVVDRALYRFVATHAPRSILEIGLTSLERTCNLLRLAQRAGKTEEIRYCGIDLFEARPAGHRLRLKDAHCQVRKCSSVSRLIPGELGSIHPGLANQLGQHDLIVLTLSSRLDPAAPSVALLSRMLTEQGHLLLREGSGPQDAYRVLTKAEVERLTGEQTAWGRAA